MSKTILAPYPNTTYHDRFMRETEKRLADQAIANAQMAVVSATEIVSQIADVNAESVALQSEVNPDYKAKLSAEASAINTSENETKNNISNDANDNNGEDHDDNIDD